MFIANALNRILRPTLGRRSFQRHYRWLYELALRGMHYGGDHDIAASGEERAFQAYARTLGAADAPVVFDVGANRGDWSDMVVRNLGGRARLHAFEPAAETHALLAGRLGAAANVALHPFALGAEEATATLYSDGEASGLASLTHRRLDHADIQMARTQPVAVRRLDAVCAERGIDRIGFLKMDVEGHELGVLRGAGAMLAPGKIDLIQFEFGGCNIDTHTYFQDFWYLLNPNYRLFRVVRDGLFELPHYAESLEIFRMVNYLAVSRAWPHPIG